MKDKIFLVIIIVALGCKTPKPDFDIWGPKLISGKPIQFTNLSTNAIELEWDFGDGISSNEEHPIHTYGSSGVYYVKLTATNDKGKSEFTEQEIRIDPGTREILPGCWNNFKRQVNIYQNQQLIHSEEIGSDPFGSYYWGFEENESDETCGLVYPFLIDTVYIYPDRIDLGYKYTIINIDQDNLTLTRDTSYNYSVTPPKKTVETFFFTKE